MEERETSVIAHDLRDTSAPDRNLALELVRVTEAAALAAARWVGRGDKEGADQAAVDAMRFTLHAVPMDGIVVIGEGEKDKAPMLYNGEQIGDGSPPEVDVAVDPLEGTRLTAMGQPSALSVVALAERGSMFDPGPCVYMEKLAGGPEIADLLDLDRPLEQTLRLVAERKGSDISDLMVIMLDRERHAERPRRSGRPARGSASSPTGTSRRPCWRSPRASGVDLLWGIGGTPEGVLSAAAIKSMGGQMLGRLWPRDDDERRRRQRPATTSTRCSTSTAWWPATTCSSPRPASPTETCSRAFATDGAEATTESLVMRSRSGTVRKVQATAQPPQAARADRHALRLGAVRLSRGSLDLRNPARRAATSPRSTSSSASASAPSIEVSTCDPCSFVGRTCQPSSRASSRQRTACARPGRFA